ncbi:Urocanate hydratase [Anopheles sinensis]|uniref:Urocanate hydratase n=1 Tax=Anopheles sinensis TaxID=74873 RepID=A0A084VIX8_ANOSI|nr:Urocanate hydratase [Anopheles sinensis]
MYASSLAFRYAETEHPQLPPFHGGGKGMGFTSSESTSLIADDVLRTCTKTSRPFLDRDPYVCVPEFP